MDADEAECLQLAQGFPHRDVADVQGGGNLVLFELRTPRQFPADDALP